MSSAALQHVADALTARRQCLVAADNPARHLDYLVTLSGDLRLADGRSVEIGLAYVPDRATLAPESFAAYLAAVGTQGLETVEAAGAAVSGDIDSEIVPRYLRVIAVAGGESGVPRHEARFETRQPGWANDAAVSRLA